MSIGIVDAVIICLVLLFAVTGLKNGFFKQTVLTIGTILVFIVSYYLKDYIANFLSYNLPFFNFSGPFLGLESVNIIMYQMVAFLICVVFLSAVLVVLLKITKVFEKILTATIILGIPSKILGFIVGLIEGYVIVFIMLFFLSQPAVNISILEESQFMPKIVNSSPVLSNIVSDTSDTIKEMYVLVDEYRKDNNSDKFNKNSIDIMLKNKIISVDYVENLIEKDKIKTKGLEVVLNKYR